MPVYGDYSAAINSVLTHPWITTKVERVQKHRKPLFNLITHDAGKLGLDTKNLGRDVNGDYARFKRYLTAEEYALSGRGEGEDVIHPGGSTYAEARVTPIQIMGSTGWTTEMLENANGPDDFRNIIGEKWVGSDGGGGLVGASERLRDSLYYGDATARLGRIASYNSTTRVVTFDNDLADYGWDGVDQLYNGLMVDILTVPDPYTTGTWARPALQVVVDQVNRAAKTCRITARTDSDGGALPGSGIDPDGTGVPANSDNMFVTGMVQLTAAKIFVAWRAPLGIRTIVDDGANAGYEFVESANLYNKSWYGVTIQGLDRSAAANSMYRAKVMRADSFSGGTAGTARTTDINDIEYGLEWLFSESEAPDPVNVVGICNGATRRWLAALAKNEQNGFQNIDDGRVVPGLVLNGFLSDSAGGKVIPMIPMRNLPDGEIYWLDTAKLGFWDIFPWGPWTRGGKTQFEAPGTRNLSFEQQLRYRGQLFFTRCDTMLRHEDISLT